MKLHLIQNKKRQQVPEQAVALQWIDVKQLADSHAQMRCELLLTIKRYKEARQRYVKKLHAVGVSFDHWALLAQRYQLDEELRRYQAMRRDFRSAYDAYLSTCVPEKAYIKSKIYS